MCREHADRVVALARQAEQHESCTTIEPLCEEMVSIANAHPECRSALAGAFVAASCIAHETVEFCMHVLRWDDVRATFEEQLDASKGADDWRAIPVLLGLLESFRDDWRGRDLWARFR